MQEKRSGWDGERVRRGLTDLPCYWCMGTSEGTPEPPCLGITVPVSGFVHAGLQYDELEKEKTSYAHSVHIVFVHSVLICFNTDPHHARFNPLHKST